MKRAVLYLRVSRSTDESVSLARQRQELTELARREGWPVVAVVEDDGISGRVEREKAEAALRMIKEGAAEVLVSWELSRWSRMGLAAVAKLVEVLEARPSALLVFHKEGLRSDQPAFGIMAAVIAEVARMEAEGTRDRIRSMRAFVLGQTEPDAQRWLGGRVPFGYRAVPREDGAGKKLVVDEVAAVHVREVARRLLAGQSLTEVTSYLTDHVPTPQAGGAWRISTVRKMIQSPTLIGRTTQRVQVSARADGSPVYEDRVVTDGQGLPITRWEPVLDPGTFAAVQALFAKRGPNRPRKAASWLSGLLYCGLCGSVMYANSRRDRGVDSFRCGNKAFAGATCPGVSISRRGVEEYVEGEVLGMIGHLQEFEVSQHVEGADPAELDAVALAIEDLQKALVQDGADYAQLLPQLDKLKAERKRLIEQPARLVKSRKPTGRTLAEAWAEGSIAQRRFLIDDMLDSVEVAPAQGSRKPEDRVQLVWIEWPVADD